MTTEQDSDLAQAMAAAASDLNDAMTRAAMAGLHIEVDVVERGSLLSHPSPLIIIKALRPIT